MPVDAAGLLLLRNRADRIEVLLGRRHGKSSFLPDYYVFPGGRVDPGDSQTQLRIAPDVAANLARAARRPAHAFVQAAIRETKEETGLRYPPERTDQIDYVCQAVTPTYSPRRYNTRFLLADGDACEDELRTNGELDDLAWRPAERLDQLTMLDISLIVLREGLDRWRRKVSPGAELPLRVMYLGNNPRFARVPPKAQGRP
jgi:8-oxo-dGTP pyrophosphatase MutT (NUDIX family)